MSHSSCATLQESQDNSEQKFQDSSAIARRKRRLRQKSESAKRCRERRRVEQELMTQKFEQNEYRIHLLEQIIDAYISELGKKSEPERSRDRGKPTRNKSSRTPKISRMEDDTPHWFGDPF